MRNVRELSRIVPPRDPDRNMTSESIITPPGSYCPLGIEHRDRVEIIVRRNSFMKIARVYVLTTRRGVCCVSSSPTSIVLLVRKSAAAVKKQNILSTVVSTHYKYEFEQTQQ